jgi:hypothetical protein
MSKNKNPFALRKSPVEIISAQAVTLDDYIKKRSCGGDFDMAPCISNAHS